MDDLDSLFDKMDVTASARHEQAPLAEKYHKVAHIAHGWFMRSHRGVAAILALQDVGFQGEANPLARSVVEHVVSLRWLVSEGAAVLDPLKRGHAKSTSKLLTNWQIANAGEVNEEHFAAVLASVEVADRSTDHLVHVWPILDKYGTPIEKTEYMKQVMRSHPTYQSSVSYWDSTNKEALNAEKEPSDLRQFCVVFLYKAMAEMNTIFEPQPWTDFLGQLAPRLRAVGAEDI